MAVLLKLVSADDLEIDLGMLIATAILLIISGRVTLARQSTDRTSLQFTFMDLDGFGIASPMSVLPVVSASQCVLACLQASGCTSVAMSGGICITFDGAVIPDAHALYGAAYDSRDLSQRCPSPLPTTPDVEVRHIYPYPHGYATLSCMPGYVGQTTTSIADASCVWAGLKPSCYKIYKWMNNSYFFNPTGMSWGSSREECESYGGWLADIHSPAENYFLVNTMGQLNGPPPHNRAFWIGGVRFNHSYPFVWYHSNRILNFMNFYGDEPQRNNENCLGLFNNTGLDYGWGNARCGRPQGYPCKIHVH